MKTLFIALLLFFITPKLCAISFLTDYKASKSYQNKDYKKTKQILEQEQVEYPDDALLNYNLGNVYYKLGKFEPAKTNFGRAVSNCKNEQKALKEQAYFNWGNSFYKNCLDFLGPDWEKNKIEDEKLDFAISEVKGSMQIKKS